MKLSRRSLLAAVLSAPVAARERLPSPVSVELGEWVRAGYWSNVYMSRGDRLEPVYSIDPRGRVINVTDYRSIKLESPFAY